MSGVIQSSSISHSSTRTGAPRSTIGRVYAMVEAKVSTDCPMGSVSAVSSSGSSGWTISMPVTSAMRSSLPALSRRCAR